MQKRDEYAATDRSEKIGDEEGAAEQLNQLLAEGLPCLYRRAYRILGNAADAEDAHQDALLAAYTHLHSLEDKHSSLPGDYDPA